MFMKTFISTKGGRLAVAGVLAAGLLVGGVTVANAASDCTNLMYPLCPRSVAKTQVVDGSLDGVEIKDGSLEAKDISPADRAAFLKDTDVNGTSKLVAAYSGVVIEHTGGSWLTRNTKLGSFTLPAGTYTIDTSAIFRRIKVNATDPATVTRPQLALRFNVTSTSFGSDVGTVMGNDISPILEGDLSGSDVRRVQLSSDTTIGVYAFGYQDDRGSSDSGNIEVLRALISVQQG